MLCHFAYRWVATLLTRELPMEFVIRIFDSYFSFEERFLLIEGTENEEVDPSGKSSWVTFHLYVCGSLLKSLSSKLKKKKFEEMMILLQNVRKLSWSNHKIVDILSEAQAMVNFEHNNAVKWKVAIVSAVLLCLFQTMACSMMLIEAQSEN